MLEARLLTGGGVDARPHHRPAKGQGDKLWAKLVLRDWAYSRRAAIVGVSSAAVAETDVSRWLDPDPQSRHARDRMGPGRGGRCVGTRHRACRRRVREVF